MARPPRLEYAGAFYHVFSRGNRKELIFRDDQDYQYFQTTLLELGLKCALELYAWCLMPNHFHLVLRTPQANLSYFMRRMLTRYALRFNRRHNLVGHVFQSRYRAVLCEQESYFLRLIRYVHRNPLGKGKPGLVKSLDQWAWSSHPYFCQAQNPPGTKILEALKQFGDRRQDAVENYRLFLQETGMPEEKFEANGIFGSEPFVEQAKNRNQEPVRDDTRELPSGMSASGLVRQAELAFGLQSGSLASAKTNRGLSRIRKSIAFVGRKKLRIETTALGGAMGRGAAAVSRMVERVERKGGVTQEIERLMESLIKARQNMAKKDELTVMCKR